MSLREQEGYVPGIPDVDEHGLRHRGVSRSDRRRGVFRQRHDVASHFLKDPRDKRHYRKLKRDIKRAGNKRRRQYLKRELVENPEEAPHSEFDFGRDSSTALNRLDEDATRRRE